MTRPHGLRLLVMMPALNESATVAQVIARVPRELDGIGSVEVLVVDDGSTDDTVALSEAAGASSSATAATSAWGLRSSRAWPRPFAAA